MLANDSVTKTEGSQPQCLNTGKKRGGVTV